MVELLKITKSKMYDIYMEQLRKVIQDLIQQKLFDWNAR